VTPVCTVLPNGDVQLHTDLPIDPDAIPFPKRPGTLWQCDPPRQGGHLRCVHCGQDYSRHGAPKGEPEKYGLPADTPSHLMCQWSDAEWADYTRSRYRATVALFTATLLNDLARFSEDDQTTILRAVAGTQAR
jgi:hypothetical protein